jgi:hypothetical protein
MQHRQRDVHDFACSGGRYIARGIIENEHALLRVIGVVGPVSFEGVDAIKTEEPTERQARSQSKR